MELHEYSQMHMICFSISALDVDFPIVCRFPIPWLTKG